MTNATSAPPQANESSSTGPELVPRRRGRVIADALRILGVDRIFCVPGESHLDILDALHDMREIEVVTTKHAGPAAIAAKLRHPPYIPLFTTKTMMAAPRSRAVTSSCGYISMQPSPAKQTTVRPVQRSNAAGNASVLTTLSAYAPNPLAIGTKSGAVRSLQ